MVVWNHGTKKIFITVEYQVDPRGGPATPINQIYVGPGQGIDLDILDLKDWDPKTKICLTCLLEDDGESHNCRSWSFGLDRSQK